MTPQTGVVITRGCAPCHPAIDTLMTGVAERPGRARHRRLDPAGLQRGELAVDRCLDLEVHRRLPRPDLAQCGRRRTAQRYEAVGRDGDGSDGLDLDRWRDLAEGQQSRFRRSPLRLTSITPWKGGFVAGGYRGNEFFSADAMLWYSPDGLTWQRATDSPAFKDARVWGVAAGGAGPGGGRPDRARPMRPVRRSCGPRAMAGPGRGSPPGRSSTAAGCGPIANVPSIGLVAVGEDIAGDTGRIWTSKDGRTWSIVPTSPIFGRPGIQVRMYTVTRRPGGLVVGGTLDAGVQYGEAAIWTSPDGVAWTRTPDGPEFLDNEVTAGTGWNNLVVAVGDRGAPDAYQATTWLSPANVGR